MTRKLGWTAHLALSGVLLASAVACEGIEEELPSITPGVPPGETEPMPPASQTTPPITSTPTPPPAAVDPGAVRPHVQWLCDDYSCMNVDSLVIGPAKPEDTGGDFVLLDVTIVNRSEPEISYSIEDFTVVDTNGVVYHPVAGAGKPSLGRGTLAMGLSVSGELLYTVPPGTELRDLEWCRPEHLPRCPSLGMSILSD